MTTPQAPRTPEELAATFAAGRGTAPEPKGAAVLVPLIETEGGLSVLFEQRAFDLGSQPGEVCFPGGRTEPGETPRETVLRETCEELLIRPEQIRIIGELPESTGPGGVRLWSFVGTISGYEGTFASSEVAQTFSIPLQWFFDHEPDVYHAALIPTMPEDFPYHLIPYADRYGWKPQPYDVRFYTGTDPLLWGMSARVLHTLVQMLRAGSSTGPSKTA